MYILLLIALVAFIGSWFILRHYSDIWVRRPLDASEAMASGIASWLHVCSHLLWYAGMGLTVWNFLVTHDLTDIWVLLFAALVTGYAIDFYVRSQSGIGVEDTKEFLKEGLQFRRSAQHRLNVLEVMERRRAQRQPELNISNPAVMDRIRLQDNLSKEGGVKKQLSLLQRGNAVDITDIWKQQIEDRSKHPFLDSVEEVRIDPQRKRLMLQVMFSEVKDGQWTDDTNVLRLNRQVYEFFCFLHTQPWLKPYASFIESYFLICRSTKQSYDGQSIAYPFMKVGMTTADIQKFEGAYFNPRRLSELAAVAFAHGEPV